MSLKWTGSESGILRKSEFKEKKEELFVFGYSCKLFRDDDRALLIDQGKHLIPWMGDETLKIDRYDARGALHDLSTLEAPPGGFDWRVELTRTEQEVEQLCDEERYRAMHTNEDEEEMYKEEELKRLHAAGYGQVGFNYDAPKDPEPPAPPVEVDEPFLPTATFKAMLPHDIVLPETDKQNAIIEKTSKFIASQGAQMEILIKAKQRDNPQFQFLNRDSVLHPYYTALTALVKSGRWPEKKPEIVEEKPVENEDYLHPSLASTIIELAPSIPSIHYKPSADCDYTMLISKMRGESPPDESYAAELAPGEVAPPGTEPLPPPHAAEISRAPVMYNRDGHGNQVPEPSPAPAQVAQATYTQQYAAYYHQYMAQSAAIQAMQATREAKPPLKSTGLSLMKNYNTDSESGASDTEDTSSTDSKDKPTIVKPPDDVHTVIDKMAAYVARNGAEFSDIVRAKRDPRFAFLDPDHEHHSYYSYLLNEKMGENGSDEKKNTVPVSFCIKKLKEPDPILPKPALPYESSSDEDPDSKHDKTDEKKDAPKNNVPQIYDTNIPPVVMYKIEGKLENNVHTIKAIDTVKLSSKPVPILTNVVVEKAAKKESKEDKLEVIEKVNPNVLIQEKISKEDIRRSTESRTEKRERDYVKTDSGKYKGRESPNKEKRYHRVKKRERVSKADNRERRSVEREKKREKDSDRVKKRKKNGNDDLENEIISLEDNSNEMIDLTGDLSDSKGEGDLECDRVKQQARRRRAAEFLKKVGVDPAAALPTSSLASAMVDTLESLRKKKAEEEEKRRKREKRRHKDRHGYNEADKSHRKSKRRKYKSSDENEDLDYDSSKKKKRKKDKKASKSKKKRRREAVEEVEEEVDHPLPPDMDLTTTLKELRTASPTRELGLQDVEKPQQNCTQDSSSEEEVRKTIKNKKEDRSEGEWSSDSEEDSAESDREYD